MGDAKDDVFVYAPPSNCRNIPSDAVPEWHIGASRTCLLPDLEYGDGRDAECGVADEKAQSKDELQRSNITTSFHCCGSLLTLSIMAREVDVVQCFLYYNGQMTRFMPKDVKVLFPKIFNMRWNAMREMPIYGMPNSAKSENRRFVESNEI